MISFALALRLKESGLEWEPQLHDFFAIPNTALENRVFVVNDMMIDVQRLYGRQMITFNGAVEWSLDYITIADALWLPSERQLRAALMDRLRDNAVPSVLLEITEQECTCTLTYEGTPLAFKADKASNAYARALVILIKQASG
jgi:hypothetical protein